MACDISNLVSTYSLDFGLASWLFGARISLTWRNFRECRTWRSFCLSMFCGSFGLRNFIYFDFNASKLYVSIVFRFVWLINDVSIGLFLQFWAKATMSSWTECALSTATHNRWYSFIGEALWGHWIMTKIRSWDLVIGFAYLFCMVDVLGWNQLAYCEHIPGWYLDMVLSEFLLIVRNNWTPIDTQSKTCEAGTLDSEVGPGLELTTRA